MSPRTASAHATRAKILTYLETHGVSTFRAIASALEMWPTAVSQSVKGLCREGKIKLIDGTGPFARYAVNDGTHVPARAPKAAASRVDVVTRDEFERELAAARADASRALTALREDFVTALGEWAALVTKLRADVAELEYRIAPRDQE